MKKFFLSMMAVAMVSIAGVGCSNGADSAADKAAIEAVVDAYIKTINDGDTDLAHQIWANEGIVTFIGPQGHFKGVDEICERIVMRFKNNFTQRDLKKERTDHRCGGWSGVGRVYLDFRCRS